MHHGCHKTEGKSEIISFFDLCFSSLHLKTCFVLSVMDLSKVLLITVAEQIIWRVASCHSMNDSERDSWQRSKH